MPVVNLTAAAAVASQNVQIVFQTVGQNLQTRLNQWLNAIAQDIKDPESLSKRTVLNWIPRGNELSAATPTVEAEQTQTDANDIALYVWQTCTAAEYARFAGRISNAEAAALIAQFNAIWP